MSQPEPFYYDSLEEDNQSSDEATIKPKSREKSANKCQSANLSQIVPLYEKEATQKEVLSKKGNHPTKKLSIAQRNQRRTSINNKNCSSVSASTTNTSLCSSVFLQSNVVGGDKRRSYVGLFHAKCGLNSPNEMGECDSFKTARSSGNSSDFSDAVSSTSDSGRKFEENAADLSNKFACHSTIGLTSDAIAKTEGIYNPHRIPSTELYDCNQLSALSTVNNNNNSKTISDIAGGALRRKVICRQSVPNLTTTNINGNSANRKIQLCGKKHDKDFMKVPTLGGLGPDPERTKTKLDNLKRQQSYGQRVSNLNRMRMLESKVVRNFKMEMRKSSELNRCVENVLQS